MTHPVLRQASKNDKLGDSKMHFHATSPCAKSTMENTIKPKDKWMKKYGIEGNNIACKKLIPYSCHYSMQLTFEKKLNLLHKELIILLL